MSSKRSWSLWSLRIQGGLLRLNPGVTATEKPLKQAKFCIDLKAWNGNKWHQELLFSFYERVTSVAYREADVSLYFMEYLNCYLTKYSYTQTREKASIHHIPIKQVQRWWEICTQSGNQSAPNGEDSLPWVLKFVCDLVLFSPSVNDLDDGTKRKLIKYTGDTELEGL